MPTNTYTPLANITLGSSAASVSFSSINQGFRDLVLVINGKTTSTSGNNNSYVYFNNDTGNNYSMVRMSGDGSTAQSDSVSGVSVAGWAFIELNGASNGTVIYNIMDYSATDKHKTVLGRGSGASQWVSATASRWANTAAITTMTVSQSGANWASGSTFALYGIAS